MAEVQTPGYDPAEYTIEEILDYVGGDGDRAMMVLDAERARGDKTRSTLVEKLEGVIHSDADPGSGDEPEPDARPQEKAAVVPGPGGQTVHDLLRVQSTYYRRH